MTVTTKKIVINKSYGQFCVSHKAFLRLRELSQQETFSDQTGHSGVGAAETGNRSRKEGSGNARDRIACGAQHVVFSEYTGKMLWSSNKAETAAIFDRYAACRR